MAHDRIGYRLLERQPAPGWRSVWAICRWNLRMVSRQKLFWFLVSIGLLSFLYHYAIIYIKAQINIENPQFAQFIDQFRVTGDGRAYINFLSTQSRAVVILLAYAGVALVVSDFRAGGISFYLSKPISKYHYIFGKTITLWIIIGLLTLGPGLFLFAAYGFLSNSMDYFIDNPRVVLGIVGYSVVIMTVPSLLLLAVGSVCRSGAPLLMVWCGVFLVIPAFAWLLRVVFETKRWLLIDLWRNMLVVGKYLFGADPYSSETTWALLVIAWVCAVSIGTLRWRLRAVEIIE